MKRSEVATGLSRNQGGESCWSGTGPVGRLRPAPAGTEKPHHACCPWTEDDDRLLRELWAERVPAAGIAERLGRTRAAVAVRASNAGLALRTSLWGGRRSAQCRAGDRAERRCLKCGLSFASAHRGNRICGPCAADEDRGSGADFSQRRIPRRRPEEIDG